MSFVSSGMIGEIQQAIRESGERYGVETGSLERYVVFGLPPGGFLSAVLRNDFMEAAGRADDSNQRKLHQWAKIVYNDIPRQCHGSAEAVSKWIEKGGLEGKGDAK